MTTNVDEKILDILQQNCKTPIREISKKIMVPVTTVHNRIKKMENIGIIKGYTITLDNKMLGKTIKAIVHISVTSAGKQISQQDLAERLYQMPEVEDCYITTGKTDICAHVLVGDLNELNNFISNKLKTLPGVERATTSVVLQDISDNPKKNFIKHTKTDLSKSVRASMNKSMKEELERLTGRKTPERLL